jgi:hypothetical protein
MQVLLQNERVFFIYKNRNFFLNSLILKVKMDLAQIVNQVRRQNHLQRRAMIQIHDLQLLIVPKIVTQK